MADFVKSIAGTLASGAVVVCLALPASAAGLGVSIGGSGGVNAGVGASVGGSGGVNAGLGASVGGSNGVSAGAGVSVGGASGVNAGLGASVGGSKGISAGGGTSIGGSGGVNAGATASIGGSSGVNAGLGASIGGGSGTGVGVGVGIGGTASNPSGSSSQHSPGTAAISSGPIFGTPSNTGKLNPNSPAMPKAIAQLSDTKLMKLKRRCAEVMNSGNYDSDLQALCALLTKVNR